VQAPNPPLRVFYIAGAFGFALLVVGTTVGLTHKSAPVLLAALLQGLGSAILFPILVSYTYDKLREKWLGDEVWRLFAELSEAGISRLYKDREVSNHGDNAQTRLAAEFQKFEAGEICIIGVTLRVFFNPLGPIYPDIEMMLRNGKGRVTIRALISDPESPEIHHRATMEEPNRPESQTRQTDRDTESTVATIRNLVRSVGAKAKLKYFQPAPYCTAVIFPHVAYYSPNLLAPVAPVRLPMILFRSGSHGYKMLQASFGYLWDHPDSKEII